MQNDQARRQAVLVIQGFIFVVMLLAARFGLLGEFSAWWKRSPTDGATAS